MLTNEDILEADDIFDPKEFDNYVNMEPALDRNKGRPEFEIVNKRLEDKDGRLVGNCRRQYNPRHEDI